VSPDRREEWLAARVRDGTEVLICHPRLVQTGLDLVDWPSICWYETEYSVYVLRQASRRSWRIGQRQPVEVNHLVYRQTLQADALALVSSKMQASLMIEGDLPEEGLAALAGHDQDVMLALARRLTDRSESDEHSLEALFARPREAEEDESRYLSGECVAGESPGLVTESGDGGITGFSNYAVSLKAAGAEGDVEESSDAVAGRVICFEDLARLVSKPRKRRPTVPDAQLPLFGE
jgi:hypothetical protein